MQIVKWAVVLLLLPVASGCTSDEQRIAQTTKEFLHLALQQDEARIYKLMCTRNNSKMDTERNNHYIRILADYLQRYQQGTIEKFFPVRSDSIDVLGRRVVKLPLFSGIDSTNGLKQADLYLFFGPKFIADYNHLQSFELEQEFDMKIRRNMFPVPVIRYREGA